MAKPQFVKAFEDLMGPKLVAAGFARNKDAWLRIRYPFVDCVELQTRSDQKALCVNFGETFAFLLKTDISNPETQASFRVVDCEFGTRLIRPPSEVDGWWEFSENEAILPALVESLIEQSKAFFDRYADFPCRFITISQEAIGGESAFELFPTTKVRRILTMVRIHEFLGNASEAISWSEFGLKNGGMASSVKGEFRDVIRRLK